MPPARILTDENLRHYAPAALPATAPLVLTCLQPHEADAVADLLTARVHLLSLDCSDWEHAFSPWPAPRAFKKAPDFSGGATETLARLAALLPVVDHASPFSRVACVSGSLWFDGWLDFATSRLLQTPPTRACFSLGDDEKNSRHPRLATVENATRATACHWLQQEGIRTTFALNPGGHFDDIAARTAAAINWLAAD